MKKGVIIYPLPKRAVFIRKNVISFRKKKGLGEKDRLAERPLMLPELLDKMSHVLRDETLMDLHLRAIKEGGTDSLTKEEKEKLDRFSDYLGLTGGLIACLGKGIGNYLLTEKGVPNDIIQESFDHFNWVCTQRSYINPPSFRKSTIASIFVYRVGDKEELTPTQTLELNKVITHAFLNGKPPEAALGFVFKKLSEE